MLFNMPSNQLCNFKCLLHSFLNAIYSVFHHIGLYIHIHRYINNAVDCTLLYCSCGMI